MSRHPSEPPADWLPSSEEDGTAHPAQGGEGRPAVPPQGYPPMPDYPSTPEYPQAPGYPSIADDEYRRSGDPYGQPQEEYGQPQEAYKQPQQAYGAPHQPYAKPQPDNGPDKSDYGQASDPQGHAHGGYAHPYQPDDAHDGYGQPQDEYAQSPAGYGQTAPGYGQTRDEYGRAGLVHGQPHPGYGQTGPGYDEAGPGYDEAGPRYDEAGPGYGQAQNGYGQPGPGYAQAPADFGSAQPEYGVYPGDHGPPIAGELPALPEPGPDTTAALRRIRPEQPAPHDVAPWPDGPDAADARWSMLGYLTVPLFGFLVPLAVYLRNLRGSSWTRAHAAQALNVWITVMLYNISAVIMGTMLALDSPRVALIVFAPLILALWLVTLAVLVRAATAAGEGRGYDFPRWLCSPIIH